MLKIIGMRKKIAKERIQILFEEAEKAAKKDRFELADRYVELARKIGMRYNVRIPRELKRRFCKYCYTYLYPGKTAEVKIDSKKKVVKVKCLKCGKVMNFPYVKRR
ncbi:MAG: hypothetical protein J7L43_02120 [Candidatus Aenigmarchaeota archaeon]|nr:hypothetical protein [Candidatus Aenigmarchaeota archaeon]